MERNTPIGFNRCYQTSQGFIFKGAGVDTKQSNNPKLYFKGNRIMGFLMAMQYT
jgi:hypothetical protein